MKKFSNNDLKRSKFVWDNADSTEFYKDILHDLVIDAENTYRAELIPAKNQEDYTRATIWLNFLCKYITQTAEHIVAYIGEKHGWEESEDEIRKDIWLWILSRYNKKTIWKEKP